MKAKEIKFTGANGVSLPGIIWYPLCSPTMVVQITHGMTEHIGRYEQLAEYLTSYGIAVAGFDLRGHGHNPGDNQCASFGEGGWNYALHDMHLFYLELNSKFPKRQLLTVVFTRSTRITSMIPNLRICRFSKICTMPCWNRKKRKPVMWQLPLKSTSRVL